MAYMGKVRLTRVLASTLILNIHSNSKCLYLVYTQQTEINHPSLEKHLQPLGDLKSEVERKALQRLEYEGLMFCDEVTTPGTKFHENPTEYAVTKYAYYMCSKCGKVSAII